MTGRVARVLALIAVAGPHASPVMGDSPEITVSVGGASFWIGQLEDAAEKSVPSGYQMVGRKREAWGASWRLQRQQESSGDEPHFIAVQAAEGRVIEVALEWPRESHGGGVFGTLVRALRQARECRVSSHVGDCVASVSETLHVTCGSRQVIATVGWGHGHCAGTALVLR